MHCAIPRTIIGNYVPFPLTYQGISVSLAKFYLGNKQSQILSDSFNFVLRGLFFVFMSMALISSLLHVAFSPGPSLLSEIKLAVVEEEENMEEPHNVF